MGAKTVSITEIARIAGVNPSTVSRALNGSPLVKKETRLAIEAIAKECGYIPDGVAKSLSKGRTLTVGVIVPEISNSFYSRIVDAMERILMDQGYSLIICGTRFDSEMELRSIRTMLSKRVDGLVGCSLSEAGVELLSELSEDLPVVLGDTLEHNVHFSSVSVEQRMGVQLLTEHLLEQGHIEIGCITDRVSRHRMEFFKEELLKRGISVKPDYFFSSEGLGASSGYEGLQAMYRKGALPTALFAARDSIAVGVMRAAIELGLEIPGSLAVVGYDDTEISDYLYKKLTTVQQPTEVIGETMAEILLRKMTGLEDVKKNVSVSLRPKLIRRESA